MRIRTIYTRTADGIADVEERQPSRGTFDSKANQQRHVGQASVIPRAQVPQQNRAPEDAKSRDNSTPVTETTATETTVYTNRQPYQVFNT